MGFELILSSIKDGHRTYLILGHGRVTRCISLLIDSRSLRLASVVVISLGLVHLVQKLGPWLLGLFELLFKLLLLFQLQDGLKFDGVAGNALILPIFKIIFTTFVSR